MSRILTLPLLAVLIALVACGASATEPPQSNPAATADVTPSTAGSTEVTSQDASVSSKLETSSEVGKKIPDFEFTLFDGSVRSTAQLSSQGQPAFLFFFATW
jgi:ABC-type phosphate transport system substrate-binding protein